MDSRLIETFRQFQRVVTSEVGVLQEDFLGRGRPYGASRLLWEMGDGPVEVADLRERLGLDAGYASRLLGCSRARGCVSIGPSPDDARAKVVSRTDAGRVEAATLDRLSDGAAVDLLAHLSEAELVELDRATRVVTRALARRHLTIEIVDPDSRDARWCVGEYFAEIDALVHDRLRPRQGPQRRRRRPHPAARRLPRRSPARATGRLRRRETPRRRARLPQADVGRSLCARARRGWPAPAAP